MGYELYERHKEKLGYMPPEERTFGGTLKDIGVSLAKGGVGLGEAAVGLADIPTGGYAGKGLESLGVDLGAAQEYLAEQYTPAQQEAFKAVEEAKGFLPTLGAMIERPSTIGHAIVESAPSMVGGGLVGRGIVKALPKVAPMVAGALGEAAVTAGQTAETARQQSDTGLLTGKQAAQAIGAGLGTGAIGIAGGKIAQKLGIADVDTMLAGGKFAEKSNKGVLRRIIEGGISEGVFEELPQSMQEQVWTNAALGRDLGEGVGEAGAAGLLAGAVMGGGANVFTRPEMQTADETPISAGLSATEQPSIIEAKKQLTTKETAFDNAIAENNFEEANRLQKEIEGHEDFITNETERIEKSLDLPNEIINNQVKLGELQEGLKIASSEEKKDIRKNILDVNNKIEQDTDSFVTSLKQAPESMFNLFLDSPEVFEQLPDNMQKLVRSEYDKYSEKTYADIKKRLLDEPDPIKKEAIRRTQEEQNARQIMYENLFSPEQEILAEPRVSAIESARTLRKVPTVDELASRERQTQIEEAPIESESVVDLAETKPRSQVEQPLEPGVMAEEPPGLIEPEVEVMPTIADEIKASEARIVDLTKQIEREGDPGRQEDLKVEKLMASMEAGKLKRDLAAQAKQDPQFEVRQNNEPSRGLDLPNIQRMFIGQEVSTAEDGSVNVRLKNGRGVNIQSVTDVGNGLIEMAINTGQMTPTGKILGVTTGTNILLDQNFADNHTLWHENKHVLDNLGMIRSGENSALVSEFNKLRKAGKLGFQLSTHENPMLAMEENIANTFAQVMLNRQAYSDTMLGKMIQRIMDFFNQLMNFGRDSLVSLAKEVETGRIYERATEGIDQTGQTQFQVADFTKPEQRISNKEYFEVHKQKKDILQNIKQKSRMAASELKLLTDKAGGAISTRLANINPMLMNKMRELDYRTTQKIVGQLKTAKPLLDKAKKMSSQDKSAWDWARKNSDVGKINQLNEKYNMTDDYNALRGELNKIREDAVDVGYDVGFLDEYWPRVLKDREGFLKETQDLTKDPVFTQALQAQAAKMGITVDKLDDNLRADIISNLILGRGLGIGGPGSIQGRVFETIPPEYDKFYMKSDEALMQYIYAMNKKIEARRFFGKVSAKIAEIKRRNRLAKTNLIKYQDLEALTRSDNPKMAGTYQEVISKLSEDINSYEQELEKYKQQRDFTENIGSYIAELKIKGEIDPSKEQELRDILDARFHEKGTRGIVSAYKNIAYIDTMGNPLSAITQIGDLAWAYYAGGLTPKGIAGTTKNLVKAVLGKSNITKEDLGFERISQEFSDADSFSRAVNKVFKVVGLEKMDSIGKETLINTSRDNYKRRAIADPKKLKEEIKGIFGRETDNVIADLVAGNPSDNVKYLVYSRVLDFHPAALSEMPEKYLNAGNGRILYMLKSYTLKQIDVFRNEVWHNFKRGDREGIVRGMKNMVSMGALLTMANAGADEIKDWLMGKDVKFEDHVIENMLTLGGASRYMKTQVRNEGIGSSIAQQILPPFKFVDSISRDVLGDTSDGFRSIDSIPGGGKLYYWHYGRGATKKSTLAEQEFKKLKKDSSKFKKKLDKAEDKRLFMQANIEDFRQSKIVDNMQSSLNKTQALISKLKDMPQTPNVTKRIGQLNQQKEVMLERFLDRLNR